MESLVCEGTFKNPDFTKPNHTYAKEVKQHILGGIPIKLGKNGEEEIKIKINPNDIDDFKNSSKVEDFNSILKRNKDNNNITWTKIYKQAYSGTGRANSTLNSSITELIPCFLLSSHFSLKKFDENIFNEILNNLNSDIYHDIFVNDNDKTSAKNIFNTISFEDKRNQLLEGFSIFLCVKKLVEEPKEEAKKISEIKWCYRSKPFGIDPMDPSDFVLKVSKNDKNEIYGISCKAGIESSKEPKLNSYVNPVLRFFNNEEEKNFKNAFNKKAEEVFLNYVLNRSKMMNNINNIKDILKNPDSLDYIELRKTILNKTNIDVDDIIKMDFPVFKEKYKNILLSLNPDTKEFRDLQSFIISYFIEFFNKKENFELFLDFFMKRCLGKSTDSKINYFYTFKGFPNGSAGKNITPDIVQIKNFEIGEKKGVQSFLVKINKNHEYQFSIRSSQGLGCYEFPNLRFSVQ